ncbi:major facilitator superfamily transport protein (plasmid) [Natrialba magadii ATCC 43099]|uniref:Major facilitator superfamily protein n=1 Tax=Natrialba magadii (strain ATCC 43099 / DSM 3394 / CCM 3739 / CIP 104546 / IAM 13178 / JCM 8861 / NBRC 102185 / NCIMB 2190 / MS3) TaxID=547559 RepID=D3T163_NATMM|nr:MFS transporter [Natrialba magadii]ADD07322.1 major facilitator superfamily transport protein [Natrialba magadii ATCC 43099]ELY32703.1 major facilitator superfamily protein [Natrialba magadii ATCC 43099]
MARQQAEVAGPLDAFRQFFSLRRDVLVLSLAMFAFSLGFQMTNRFIPDYLVYLGAGGFVVGLFATLGNVIGAVYPYYGGVVSDRVGSRYALTVFGFLSTFGFAIWLAAAYVPTIELGAVAVGPWVDLGVITIEPWVWVFVGLLLAQCWKSFGIGGHYAIVKQATEPGQLARGFASTETFRRTAFLIAPLIVAVLVVDELMPGFLWVLVIGIVFALLGTISQHFLYETDQDTVGKEFQGVGQVVDDLRALPDELRPLLVSDALVRFANGMVYAFFILVITLEMGIGLSLTLPVIGAIDLSPAAFFGVLLSIEMFVALLTMAPVAKVAESTGLKPVVTLGFFVYAIFPIMLIFAPENAWVLIALFAFSGLRFAGLPAHKALIVGPAEQGAGGRVTGSYYLVRGAIVIPSGALGGFLWQYVTPGVSFTIASVIGLIGVAYFLLFGKEFEAYA